MAVSFSIREYALGMRSGDPDTCWPFDTGEEGRALPPMLIRKFRWWADELRTAGSEEEAVPVRSAGRAKQRMPKKRSIVELFAVSTPIDSVEIEEKEERKEGKKKKVKIKKRNLANKETILKTTKKKKKKKQLKSEICDAKKGEIPKTRLSPNCHLQDSVQKRWSGKKRENPVTRWKKPLCMKNLPKNRDFKLVQSSKLIPKNRKKVGKVIPVRSILKNSSGDAAKKTSTKPNKQRERRTNGCESRKHVSFSDKDDILEHHESCSTAVLPQLRNLRKIFSNVLADSSALENSQKRDGLQAPASVQVDDVCEVNAATTFSERRHGTLPEKEQLNVSFGHDIPMGIPPNDQRSSNVEISSLALSVDLNHAMASHTDVNRVSPRTFTERHFGEPGVMNFSDTEGLSSHSCVHAKESSTSLEKSVSMSKTVSSQDITTNPGQLSISHADGNGKQLQPPANPMTGSCFHTPGFQEKCNCSSKDVMGSVASSIGSTRLVSRPVLSYKDKCISEDYVGLPLNSQGELIQHSGSKFGFSELFNQHNTVRRSKHSYLLPNSTDPRISLGHAETMRGAFPGVARPGFQEQYYHVCRPQIPAFGFVNMRGIERIKVQNYSPLKGSDQLFHPDPNQMHVSYHEYRQDRRTHNYIDRVTLQNEENLNCVPQPPMQQTLRLMGKTVTVGSSSSKDHQAHHDGRIWTDKEVVTDQFPSIRVSNKPFWPLEAQSSFSHIPAMESGVGHVYSDHKPQWISRNGVSSTTGNRYESRVGLVHSDYQPQWMPRNCVFSTTGNRYESRLGIVHSDYQPQWMPINCVSSTIGNHGVHVDLLDKSSNSTVISKSGTASLNTGYQIPMVAPGRNNYEPILLSSAHCKHKLGIDYSSSSSFCPPFLYQDVHNCAQSSSIYSSPNLPEWMLASSHQKHNLQTSGPSNLNAIPSQHPYGFPCTDMFTPPRPHAPIVPLSVNTTSTSQKCESTAAAVIQTPSVPARSNFLVTDTCRSKNFTYLKAPDNSGKTRKRPAARNDVFMKPAKKPSSETQEPADLRRERQQMDSYPQCKKQRVGASVPETVDANKGSTTLSGSISLKRDGDSRTGPIKLSAGAKHILKPCQDADRCDCRPLHSTRPLSFGNESGRIPGTPKKPAEVYRF